MTEETLEIPQLRDHFVERRTRIGDDVLIIETFDQVTLMRSVLRTGRTRTGLTWKRWAHEDYTHFSARQVLRDGTRRLNIYRKYRDNKQWFFENVSPITSRGFGLLAGEEHLRAAIIRLHERTLGPVAENLLELPLRRLTAALAYPALADSLTEGRGPSEDIPKGLGPAYRINDARVMTEKLFGKRRTRKDLIKAAARSTADHHAIARAVRHAVPVDWLVEYMNDNRRPVTVAHADHLAAFTLVEHTSRRALLMDTFETGSWGMGNAKWRIVFDSFTLLGLIREEIADDTWITPAIRKAKTWRALHDELARIHRNLAHEERKITQDALYDAIDGLRVGDALTVVSAKTSTDLHEWGEAMSNCIAGYVRAATHHRSYLFGIYDTSGSGRKLIANMEVTPDGEIQQLFGRFNVSLAPDLHASITAAVTERIRTVVPSQSEIVLAA